MSGNTHRGVRPHGNRVLISFQYRGRRCRETFDMHPTDKNLALAADLRAKLKLEIVLRTFDYARWFPASPRAIVLGGSSVKLNDLLNRYGVSSLKTLKNSTQARYKQDIANYIRPQWGNARISAIMPDDVTSWMVDLDLAPSTVNNILVPFRQALQLGVDRGWLASNPLEKVHNLKRHLADPDPFTFEEQDLIFPQLDESFLEFFEFAMWTGLRTGELYALTWSDVDLKNKLVWVNKSYVNGDITTPKSKAGRRAVDLLPTAESALLRQRARGLAGNLVFPNPVSGEPLTYNITTGVWRNALEAAGVRYRCPYTTRHTYASVLLSVGEPTSYVAAQLGHANTLLVEERYGKWIPDLARRAGVGTRVRKFIRSLPSRVERRETFRQQRGAGVAPICAASAV